MGETENQIKGAKVIGSFLDMLITCTVLLMKEELNQSFHIQSALVPSGLWTLVTWYQPVLRFSDTGVFIHVGGCRSVHVLSNRLTGAGWICHLK